MISEWLKDEHIRRYLVIAFGFSWLMWIGAWVLSEATANSDILINAEFVKPLIDGDSVLRATLIFSIMSLLGVYGPMLGAYLTAKNDPDVSWRAIRQSSLHYKKSSKKYFMIALSILGIIIVPTLLLTALMSDVEAAAPSLGGTISLVVVFFIFQIFTSGLEEVGWRGYLLSRVKSNINFWDAGWNTGFVWALWHFPIVIMIFIQQGLDPAAIIGSLAGFTMGIVAMSILHTWFYYKTESVLLNIFIHALFNSVPLVLTVVFVDSPAAIISNLLLWGVVLYMQKKLPASITPTNSR
jgi:membrane protease YdiL (CAAX protease family)